MSEAVSKPVPHPDAEFQPYWDGAEEGKLRLQRCGSCGAVRHYPQLVCPRCYSLEVEAFDASGRGTVHSWTVAHHAFHPAFKGELPYTRQARPGRCGRRAAAAAAFDPAAHHHGNGADRRHGDGRAAARLRPGQRVDGARRCAPSRPRPGPAHPPQRAPVARRAPLSLAASKRVIVEGADWTLDEMWTRQAAITGPVLASHDAKEGAAAFAEKRPARWAGE